MSTVFSHIVQKRLSQENENIATEALAFIVNSSEHARTGLMKLLRGIAPGLPSLRFRTQQTEGSARPDMWGFDGGSPRVFIENKFWAGLTENQPVEYLNLLTRFSDPAVLLVVVPETRLETVWREFERRLHLKALTNPRERSAGVCRVVVVDFGPLVAIKPILAITSWTKVLSAIEAELIDEPLRRNDLLQLRALCLAADEYAPFSMTELTNQRIPSLILQLSSVVEAAMQSGITEGVLSNRFDGAKRLDPTHGWDKIGRYMAFPKAPGVGVWFGTDFRLWRMRGSTPLWISFSTTKDFGRALEVRPLLESWAERKNIATSIEDDGSYAVGIEVISEEQDFVIRSIVEQMRDIATELSRLPARPGATP